MVANITEHDLIVVLIVLAIFAVVVFLVRR